MNLHAQYQPLIIKTYDDWTLVLNEKQWPYLGRCYAWWKDHCPAEGEGLRPNELPPDALLELQTIFSDVERACEPLGYSTRPYGEAFLLNMCYLANLPGHKHHMHWHFIPRSTHPIVLTEIEYSTVDHRWGDNYEQPREVPPLPYDTLQYIRGLMADTIARPSG